MVKQKSNSVLPSSWLEVEWSEITSIDGFRRGPFGGNLKKSCFIEKGYSVYEQYAPINDDCTSFRYFIDEEKYQELSGFHVNEGDFLISCSGTMGRITHVPVGAPKGLINQALLRIRLQDQFILPDYFLKLFRSPSIQNSVLNKTVGGAIQNLAAVKELKTIQLPIAPIAEQKRIVEKLDSLLAQVDIIGQRLNNLPKIIKRFRQSVLAAAVSGKLTEQWRIEKEFDNWNTLNFEYLILESGNGLSKRRGEEGTETTILRLADFKDAVRVKGKERQISLTDKEVGKYTLHNDDILVIRVNGSIDLAGKFILYAKETDCEGYCDHFIRIKINTVKAIPKFITYIANEGIGRHYLVNSLSTSAGQNTINQKSIKALKINLPPIEEQTEIVRLVEQHFALADTLEKNLKNAKQRVDNLTQSILAKAFRGELVPQDPNDEPAEQLLARIKAARAEAELLEKAAKKVTSKTKRQKGVVS
jgi:type I restriction enzyme S subunit